MMEETSSFFSIPDTPPAEVPLVPTLIHSSERGFCDLFRIDRSGRFRALKCLKPEFRGNRLYESLLKKEFEIGYSLSHPNICEYYAFITVEGLGSCIEMEWIDGRTLETVVEEEKPGAALCDKILDEICDALTYTHSKQVLHRDLKPSNILVTYTNNNVKLIDFGFSDSDTHSVLKTPAGTFNYTAPEVLEGGPADVRSDIYSLGIVMSRLTRRHRSVARKCCENNPNRRYTTIAEVKKALHDRKPLLSGIIFLLLIATVALLLYPGRHHETSAPGTIPVTADSLQIKADTVKTPAITDPAAQEDLRSQKTPAPQTKKEKPSEKNQERKDQPVNPEVIDELFRQATDLFN